MGVLLRAHHSADIWLGAIRGGGTKCQVGQDEDLLNWKTLLTGMHFQLFRQLELPRYKRNFVHRLLVHIRPRRPPDCDPVQLHQHYSNHENGGQNYISYILFVCLPIKQYCFL